MDKPRPHYGWRWRINRFSDGCIEFENQLLMLVLVGYAVAHWSFLRAVKPFK